MLDATQPTLLVGIVGAGLMGRGIAQIAAQGGIQVLLYDTNTAVAQQAYESLQSTFNTLVAKQKIAAKEAELSLQNIRTADHLNDLAPCHVVIEAIVENLEIKQAVFQELERIVSDNCLLATNTSSLSVTAIAAQCRLPQRVGGFHFFSPVPLMKVVEVIQGLLTEPWVTDALTQLALRMGHAPVRAKDTPGFIVNHAGRGFGTEALRIVDECIADTTTIDAVLRQAGGFRMGPFQLLDLTGLDVSHPAMESIYHQYYQEPRFRPSPITKQRVDAGLLGRKTSRGFYHYDETAILAEPTAPPLPSHPAPIWVSPQPPAASAALIQLLGAQGATVEHGATPSAHAICIVLPIGDDATTTALQAKLDPTRTLAVDPLYLQGHRTIMRTPLSRDAASATLHAYLAADGTPVSVINDSPGFIVQRVIAMIVNISCDIAQKGIASPQDIDKAVTLGLAYPAGPLALGDQLGAGTVLQILNAMYHFYRDPRYRPSPWLTRRAKLGLSLLTPER